MLNWLNCYDIIRMGNLKKTNKSSADPVGVMFDLRWISTAGQRIWVLHHSLCRYSLRHYVLPCSAQAGKMTDCLNQLLYLAFWKQAPASAVLPDSLWNLFCATGVFPVLYREQSSKTLRWWGEQDGLTQKRCKQFSQACSDFIWKVNVADRNCEHINSHSAIWCLFFQHDFKVHL